MANNMVKRAFGALAVLCGVSLGVAAVDIADAPKSAMVDKKTFWSHLQIEGDEVEQYDSFSELTSASDIVVVGKLRNFRANRQLLGGAKEDRPTYAAIDVQVEHVLKGDVSGNSPLVVEFLLPYSPQDVAEVVHQQRQHTPAGAVLLFLHEKRGPGEKGIYRLTDLTYGLWDEGGSGVRAPLALEQPSLSYPELTSAEVERSRARDLESLRKGLEDGTIVKPDLTGLVKPSSADAEPTQADEAAEEHIAARAIIGEAHAVASLEDLATKIGLSMR